MIFKRTDSSGSACCIDRLFERLQTEEIENCRHGAGFSLRLGSEDITGASDGSTDCPTACGRRFDVRSRRWAGHGRSARVSISKNLARIDLKLMTNDNGNQENQQGVKEGEEARKHPATSPSVAPPATKGLERSSGLPRLQTLSTSDAQTSLVCVLTVPLPSSCFRLRGKE